MLSQVIGGVAVAILLAGCTVTFTGPEADPGSEADSEAASETQPESDVDSESGVDREQNADSESGVEAVVERVIDGDSLELGIGGDTVEVRLVGINAPELYTIDDVASCNGEAARAHLRELVGAGSTTRFVAGETDRFGRILGVLLVDGVSVADSLVDAGLALSLWSGDDESQLASMQTAAAAGTGMWGDDCGQPAAVGLVIADTQADPPGDDRNNLGEEWVVIANTGDAPIDLDGWTIRDETTSNRFRIDRATIDPGAELRIRTGSGPTTRSDLYLGEELPVWSNGGDTALLLDPDGRIAAHAFIAP